MGLALLYTKLMKCIFALPAHHTSQIYVDSDETPIWNKVIATIVLFFRNKIFKVHIC